MILKFIAINLMLVSFSLAHAKTKSHKTRSDQDLVAQKIISLIHKSKIPESSLGVYIATEDKKLVDINSDKMFIPASITKIATAAAVLNKFPGGTKFKTTLLAKDSVESGSLKGPICLKGGGDPSFVSETMWFLVNSFTRKKIKKIEGGIIVDDSLFDHISFDSSREDKRVDRAFDAPVGAMSFNWNSVNIFINPNSEGGAANVSLDPENDYVRLVNNVRTGSGTSVVANRVEDSSFDGDKVIVNGKIASDSKELVIFKNITSPGLWSGYNLKSFLQQRGIEVLGNIKIGTCANSYKVVAEAESKPIENILSDMDKFSNNFVAEMLTKNLSASETEPGSIAGGMKEINAHLQRIGIDAKTYHFVNPSGLTRENKATPKVFWQILNSINERFEYKYDFINSLPISGIDGTLKKRMTKSSYMRRVRAKTGSLDGVVSLAGYIDFKNGESLPFVMMFNGSQDESKVRGLFDQIVEVILDEPNKDI